MIKFVEANNLPYNYGFSTLKALPDVKYLLALLSTVNPTNRIFDRAFDPSPEDLGRSKQKIKIISVPSGPMFVNMPTSFYTSGSKSKSKINVAF